MTLFVHVLAWMGENVSTKNKEIMIQANSTSVQTESNLRSKAHGPIIMFGFSLIFWLSQFLAYKLRLVKKRNQQKNDMKNTNTRSTGSIQGIKHKVGKKINKN